MTVQPAPPGRRRRRRRRRVWPAVLLTFLIIISITLVVADRAGKRLVEDRVAEELQRVLDTPAAPEVEVLGVPFLTQAIDRRFAEATVTAEQIPVTGRRSVPGELNRLALILREVNVDATVPAPGDQLIKINTVRADTIDGTAFFDYASLSRLSATTIAKGDGPTVTIDFDEPVAGQSLRGRLTGRPTLTNGQLGLDDPQLRLAGVDLPRSLVDALLATILASFTLPDPPLGLTLTSVEVGDDGLTFGVVGRGVTIAVSR